MGIRGRPGSTPRRTVTAVLALLVLSSLAAGARADTKHDLAKAKAELDALLPRIEQEKQALAAQQAKVHAAQMQLNKVATEIDAAQTRYASIQGRVFDTRQELATTREHYRRVRDRLDSRARIAYEQGAMGDLALILGSATLADLSDRVEYLSRLSESDASLAADVQNQANALTAKKNDLEDLLVQQVSILNQLDAKRRDLDARFQAQQGLLNQQQDIVDNLTADQNRVNQLITKLKHRLAAEELARARAATHGGPTANDGPGPLFTCPVDQPHAYGDSFGAPRYAGGYHPHAGNDILAPEGTPIRAPFDGVATNSSNSLGGNAVVVTGAQGWVYNAHLSAYGQLGQVSTGTIIGYVGNTGDARGGPTHDHFEWHPYQMPANPYRSVYGVTVIGSAIDPYPYLNEVC